jgi:hypothetical protein
MRRIYYGRVYFLMYEHSNLLGYMLYVCTNPFKIAV